MSVYDKSSRSWYEADEPRTTKILRFVNHITEGKVVSIARQHHPQDPLGPCRYRAIVTLGGDWCTIMWGATESACADEVVRWLAAQVEQSLARVSGVRGWVRSWAHQMFLRALRRLVLSRLASDPHGVRPGQNLVPSLAPWTATAVDPSDQKRYLTSLRDEVHAFARAVGVDLPGHSSYCIDPLDPLP